MDMRLTIVLALAGTLSIGFAQTDWPTYGHDPGGIRYSPLKQITAANAARPAGVSHDCRSGVMASANTKGPRAFPRSRPLILNGTKI